MESLEVLQAIDPDLLELLNIFLAVFFMPLIPTLASTLKEIIGCQSDMGLILAYWAYSIYYTLTVDIAVGLMHSFAGFVGMLTVFLLCLPPDPDTLLGALVGEECEVQLRDSIRDLALATSSEEAVATVSSTLSACFSG